MNINKLLVISFIVLLLTSYETDSSILFTLLMKMLMLKGVLFMGMPLGIGAFVMGQGMGFFAGNMMGGYMMLRAANRYHNKEKARWVTHSGWHGPPYNTHTYQKGYEKGKAIISVVNAGQAKLNAIASIFKPKGFGWKAPPPKGWSSGPPPAPVYGPPGWSSGYDYSSYASHSDPAPSVEPSPYQQPHPPPSYGAPVASYGVPPLPPSSPYPASGPLAYDDYSYGSNRKNGGFSSLLSSISGGVDNQVDNQQDKKNTRRVYKEPVSPSGFYTSAYNTPGEQFTGILTNEPSTQDDKFLRGDEDNLSSSSASKMSSSSITAPNEILESYLEQRLKAEAEKQKDTERKQEAQQLVQMLRKAYLKQLVDSLKEEETKTATNRRLSSVPSSLSSSIESLFGSRESRSTEQRNNNEIEGGSGSSNSGGGGVASAQNLIRDILIKEVFTSSEASKAVGNVEEDDNIDTAEVASITERVMSLTQTEREELIKGLDELGDEEQVLQKPAISESSTERIAEGMLLALASSTENTIFESSPKGEEKKREERSGVKDDDDAGNDVLQVLLPATWIQTDNTFVSENVPFSVRVRRQTATSGSEPAPTPSPEDQKKIQGFVDDIRKFFTLLSALDQDQCLQKLVCDVHTNEKDLTTLTQYEKNILTTFKLMKALMPEGEEDSSTNYRYAAVVGETGQSMELCQQTYTSCGYSTSQIVALGTQEEATPSDWAGAGTSSIPTTPGPTIVPTVLQQQRERSTEAPSMRSDYITQMPSMARRRHQQQQQQRYQPKEQQYPYQYQRRRRPQQQQQAQEQQEPQPESSSYGDFFSAGEFFRSLWSENLMGRSNRRNRQMHNSFSSPLEYEMGV